MATTTMLEEWLEIRESTLYMLIVLSRVQEQKPHKRFFQRLEMGHVRLDVFNYLQQIEPTSKNGA